MIDVIWPYPTLLLGFILLIKGADLLVKGSSSLAKRLGISSLVIGLTIVSFGTSLPELTINVFSAIKGSAGMAIGNVIGSNIANLLLILGIAAIITPLSIKYSTIYKEVPFSLLAAFAVLVLFNDKLLGAGINQLSRGDGLILLFFFAIFMYYVYALMKSTRALDGVSLEIKHHSKLKCWLYIIAGILGVTLGGKFIVESAINIARQIGITEILISATIIAVGTSLPELATSITAALKKDSSLAVGNIVGSNIFNIFLVLGATSAIRPLPFLSFLNIDLFFLVGVSLLFLLLTVMKDQHKLLRWQGIMFLVMYAAYILFMIWRG